MPDGGTGHTAIVTDAATATEREASTRAALKSHKASCAPSADVLPCQTCTRLTFAWRQALREAAASGQITTTPAAG